MRRHIKRNTSLNLGSTLITTINKNIGELIHNNTRGLQICFIEYHETEEDANDDEDECATIGDGEFQVDSLNEDLPHVNGPNNVDEVM